MEIQQYPDYQNLTRILEKLYLSNPNLIRLTSIGKSSSGRDLWLVKMTNFSFGTDLSKPAYWVDGGFHARELVGCDAALQLIIYLLENQNSADIASLLRERVFYILPRVDVDGAEQVLKTPFRNIRSSRFEYSSETYNGLYPLDIDGDGRILQMRVVDAQGRWKVSLEDPRLLVPRLPDDEGDLYYSVYMEGIIHDFDGYTISKTDPLLVDFNRLFPSKNFSMNSDTLNNDFLSEPETIAIANFIASHSNIYAGVSYHTPGGIILYPYAIQSKNSMNQCDLAVYRAIGKRGTTITGYPAMPIGEIYADFSQGMHGLFIEWLYDFFGVYAFMIEMWNPLQEAGIEASWSSTWFSSHDEADDLKLLQWSDNQLAGQGFIEWYSFNHPQLGEVELGGWDVLFSLFNPPKHLVAKVIAPCTKFIISHAKMGSLIEIKSFHVKAQKNDIYDLEAIIVNTGYLPSYTSFQGLESGKIQPISVQLLLPPNSIILCGNKFQLIGHLNGRANEESPWGFSPTTTSNDYLKVIRWKIKVNNSGICRIELKSQQSGYKNAEISVD
jgi:hypothetical protein